MFITRQNSKGGRGLIGYKLADFHGTLGYKIGYCECCNEPIGIKQIDLRDIVDFFGLTEMKYKRLVDKFRPRQTLREWLIKWLGGNNKTVDNF